MTVLSDMEIIARCTGNDVRRRMITPFESRQVSHCPDTGNKIVSYGLSSYGYDIRLGNSFRIFEADPKTPVLLVDPKNFRDDLYRSQFAHPGEAIIIPPHGFCLSVSVERIFVPRDILVVCIGKSTYARCGLIVNVTPLEPEWEGYITLELSNTTPFPAVVYANEGIAQLIFHEAKGCSVSYADRKGKYQNQLDVTLPKV